MRAPVFLVLYLERVVGVVITGSDKVILKKKNLLTHVLVLNCSIIVTSCNSKQISSQV